MECISWSLTQVCTFISFPSPICTRCNLLKVQNVEHLVTVCPATKLEGGFRAILQMNDEFKSWIEETTY